MPRYRHAWRRPRDHLEPGQRWPNGRLRSDAPVEAVHARSLAKRLHYHMSGRTNREVAEAADIAETTLSKLLRGEAWGALPVIVRLEHALEADLWRGEPPD